MKLEARELSLGIGRRVLCASSEFEIGTGQLWCLLGRNGAGKTTLLRTLAGLRRAQGGVLKLNGRALASWSWRDLARVRTFMAQQTRDAFSTSVVDLVLAAGYAQRGTRRLDAWFDSDEERARAHAILGELDLAAFAARDVLSLSGGERQRVAVASALMQGGELLLLDEPLAHLDIDMQLAVLEVLRARVARAQNPTTVVLSVHDVNLAARAASHVLLFDGSGGMLAGAAPVVLTGPNLGRAFHHPVRELRDGENRWFVAA